MALCYSTQCKLSGCTFFISAIKAFHGLIKVPCLITLELFEIYEMLQKILHTYIHNRGSVQLDISCCASALLLVVALVLVHSFHFPLLGIINDGGI